MKKELLGKEILSIATLLLAGCSMAHRPAGDCKECQAAKLGQVRCSGDDKCFATVKEAVERQYEKPLLEEVSKECYVLEKKPVVTKVPVKTYRVIEEWVDSPVKEVYYETVRVRAKRKVPVTDEVFAYVPVPGEEQKEIRSAVNKQKNADPCKTITFGDRITRYDECGNAENLPITRQSKVPNPDNTYKEIAVCSVKRPAMQEDPAFLRRELPRNGYYTKEYQIKKYRIVPGKVLRKRRVAETVMADNVEYVEAKRPVQRKVMEFTKIVPATKIETVTRRAEVDCVTGVPIVRTETDDKTAAHGKVKAQPEINKTAQKTEKVKAAVKPQTDKKDVKVAAAQPAASQPAK